MLNILLFLLSGFVCGAEPDEVNQKTLAERAKEDTSKTGILNKVGEAELLEQQEDSGEKMPLQDIGPQENL